MDLILVSDSENYDFEMKYFNSDGLIGSMCGNGGRCAAGFAIRHGISGNEMKFLAVDGIHEAILDGDVIRLKMNNIQSTSIINGNYFINTGSPHYVIFKNEIENLDVEYRRKKDKEGWHICTGWNQCKFCQGRERWHICQNF